MKAKDWFISLLAIGVLIAAMLLTGGCVQTQFAAPGGVTFKTTRFLWNGAIATASMSGTNGESVRLEGYKSDAAEIAKAVAEGVSAGIVKGAKP